MESELPLEIVVYDKAYSRKGVVGAPNEVSVQLVWNAPGLATFTLDSSHDRVNDLATPGARCVIRHRRTSGFHTILSGLVVEMNGEGGAADPTRTFAVLDDLDELNHIVAYQVPANAPSSQSGARHDTRTGPLGNVVKGYVSANVSGQSIPKLTVQANAGDGPTVTMKARMRKLGEMLLPTCITKGLGVRIVQTGTTRQLQTWTPTTYPRVLTEESGIVSAAGYGIKPPVVTRITVGIAGTWEARQFYGPPTSGYVDTAAEALWGIRRHEFLDATDIATDDPDRAALALERATERLEEGRATASLAVELAETDVFRYGATFDLGDKVSIKPAGSGVITDRIREVQIEWAGDGLIVKPLVGERQDSPDDKQWALVRRMLRRINDFGAR